MKKYLPIILCLLVSTTVGTAFAEVYKWKDADGKVHYGDNPKEDQPAEKIELKINSYEHVTVMDADGAATDTSSSAQTGNSKKVIIYSTSWCGYCKKAKNYFREKGIAFMDYDIEKDKAAKQKYDALGGRGVPVILVGKKRMDGFSVESFEYIYK